ncbi:MAG: radical SAM protein [bacterium]
MRLLDRTKAFTARQVFNGALRILPKMSEERWLSLMEGPIQRVQMPEGRDFLRAMVVQFRRAFPRASKATRKKVINNLFVNAFFVALPRRRAFEREEGFDPPTLLVISPTMRCNLGCYGCYAGNYTKKDDLNFETVSRIIKEANDLGIYFFVISGGEPFSWHLLELLEKHSDSYFQIYTNGVLIDEAVAKRLADLGNALPCISVEGFERETDERRGPGTFRKIMSAMDNLRKYGALFGFSATATRENNELIVSDEFIDFYIDKGCFLGWYFNYIPIGRKPNVELMPTPEQRDYRRRRVIELRKTKNILLADFWNDGPLVNGCLSGGRRYLHINSKGDVEPCVFIHFAVDNIKEKSLREVICSPFFQAFRKRRPYNENLLLPCPIIDNPQILRDVVAETGAHPTHDGAETIITELKDHLDWYAREYGAVADRAWREEYVYGVYRNVSREEPERLAAQGGS